MNRKIKNSTNYFWGIAREAGATLLTYELYPLGLLGKSIPAIPSLWSRGSKRLPVLFIHGVFHNRSAFAWLKQKLVHKGWEHFQEVDLLTSIHSIPTLSEQIASQTKTLLRVHQVPQIDIVAHSMGGIIARYFVQCLGGDGVVRNLITLGTPHRGTLLSRMSILPHIRELHPESPTIKKLESCPAPKFTRAVSISGNLDIVMQPRNCTHWNGVRNISLKHVGHAGLLFSKRVYQIITSHLSEL